MTKTEMPEHIREIQELLRILHAEVTRLTYGTKQRQKQVKEISLSLQSNESSIMEVSLNIQHIQNCLGYMISQNPAKVLEDLRLSLSDRIGGDLESQRRPGC